MPAHLNKQAVFGVKDGFPVQLTHGQDGGGAFALGLIRYEDAGKDAAVADAVKAAPDLLSAGAKPKHVAAEGGVLALRMPPAFVGFPKAEVVAARMEAALRAVKAVAPAPAAVCAACKTAAVQEPVLLDGVVARVCSGCLMKVEAETRAAAEAYASRPLNLPLALAAAVVLAVAGAALWGGLIIFTNRMYWMVAVVIGVMVGAGTVKAAGKGGPVVQGIGMGFTLLSVLAGLLVFVGHNVRAEALKEGGTVDWVLFLRQAPAILVALGGDTLFSLGGGILGAFQAMRLGARPDMTVKIER